MQVKSNLLIPALQNQQIVSATYRSTADEQQNMRFDAFRSGAPSSSSARMTNSTSLAMNGINEHAELLAEMELIERLPTQERLKQAKRRRAMQLKVRTHI